MTCRLKSLSRLAVWAMIGLLVVAVLLGRGTAGPEAKSLPHLRHPAHPRYQAFSGYLFPDDHPHQTRLLDTETGRRHAARRHGRGGFRRGFLFALARRAGSVSPGRPPKGAQIKRPRQALPGGHWEPRDAPSPAARSSTASRSISYRAPPRAGSPTGATASSSRVVTAGSMISPFRGPRGPGIRRRRFGRGESAGGRPGRGRARYISRTHAGRANRLSADVSSPSLRFRKDPARVV